jgi:hypothetical protein
LYAHRLESGTALWYAREGLLELESHQHTNGWRARWLRLRNPWTGLDDYMNDLLVLGTALIRRHDRGEMTDETINRYVDGCVHTYMLSKLQADQLTQELKNKRFK